MPQPLSSLVTDVFPDFGGVGAQTNLAEIVGALLTIVLVVAVLMLAISAAVWTLSSSAGNHQAAGRARFGVWVSIGAAGLAGAAIAWMNFLLDVGRDL